MKTQYYVLFAAAALLTPSAWSAEGRNPKTSMYTVGPAVQPLVITGEGWMQKFTFVNLDYYDRESTVGRLSFYTRDGKAWRIALKDRGLVDHVDINLGAGQMITLETEVSFGAQTLGWANFKLADNISQWGIYHCFSVYRKQTAGQPDLMTSVPMVDGLEDEWIVPFDNTGGKYAGMAFVNTSTFATNSLTVQVIDLNGRTVKTFTKTVAPLNLVWFSLLADYPELANLQGQMKITGGLYSTAPLTLQFANNGAFTALPVAHTFGMK